MAKCLIAWIAGGNVRVWTPEEEPQNFVVSAVDYTDFNSFQTAWKEIKSRLGETTVSYVTFFNPNDFFVFNKSRFQCFLQSENLSARFTVMSRAAMFTLLGCVQEHGSFSRQIVLDFLIQGRFITRHVDTQISVLKSFIDTVARLKPAAMDSKTGTEEKVAGLVYSVPTVLEALMLYGKQMGDGAEGRDLIESLVIAPLTVSWGYNNEETITVCQLLPITCYSVCAPARALQKVTVSTKKEVLLMFAPKRNEKMRFVVCVDQHLLLSARFCYATDAPMSVYFNHNKIHSCVSSTFWPLTDRPVRDTKWTFTEETVKPDGTKIPATIASGIFKAIDGHPQPGWIQVQKNAKDTRAFFETTDANGRRELVTAVTVLSKMLREVKRDVPQLVAGVAPNRVQPSNKMRVVVPDNSSLDVKRAISAAAESLELEAEFVSSTKALLRGIVRDRNLDNRTHMLVLCVAQSSIEVSLHCVADSRVNKLVSRNAVHRANGIRSTEDTVEVRNAVAEVLRSAQQYSTHIRHAVLYGEAIAQKRELEEVLKWLVPRARLHLLSADEAARLTARGAAICVKGVQIPVGGFYPKKMRYARVASGVI